MKYSTFWKDNRAVLFLDPYATEVQWETLEAIAKTKSIDLLALVSLTPPAGLNIFPCFLHTCIYGIITLRRNRPIYFIRHFFLFDAVFYHFFSILTIFSQLLKLRFLLFQGFQYAVPLFYF